MLTKCFQVIFFPWQWMQNSEFLVSVRRFLRFWCTSVRPAFVCSHQSSTHVEFVLSGYGNDVPARNQESSTDFVRLFLVWVACVSHHSLVDVSAEQFLPFGRRHITVHHGPSPKPKQSSLFRFPSPGRIVSTED